MEILGEFRLKYVMTTYITLCPKYVLYMGVFVTSAAVVFFGFVYKEAVLSHDIVAAAILGVMSGIAVIWWLFFMNKFIHAKIDAANNLFVYGNLFFEREIEIEGVKIVGQFLFYRRIVKVQIGGKKYYVNSINKEIRNYLK